MTPKNKRPPSEEQLLGIESHLRSSLQPVDPDPSFVDHLRQRLVTDPDTIVETRQVDRETATLVIVSFLMVALGITALVAFIRLINFFKNKNPFTGQNSIAP